MIDSNERLTNFYNLFQSTDSEGEVRTTGHLEDSSSDDEEILNRKCTNAANAAARRLAMKPIGHKQTFKMDVID